MVDVSDLSVNYLFPRLDLLLYLVYSDIYVIT